MTEQTSSNKWKEKAGKCFDYTFLAGSILAAYFLGLTGLSYLAHKDSPRILNSSHLESVISQERTKRGVPSNIKIDCFLSSDETGVSSSRKISENHYEISLAQKANPSISTVEHELSHIINGDCEDADSNLMLLTAKYIFIQEPRIIVDQIIHKYK